MTQEKLYKIQDSNNTFIQPFNDNIIYGFKYYYEDAPLYYFVRDEPNQNKLYIYFFFSVLTIRIFQENIYNFSQNVVYLTLVLIVMYCIEKYINIHFKINKTLFVILLFHL
jgi:hypothetical protein